jgi:hypothetical protein
MNMPVENSKSELADFRGCRLETRFCRVFLQQPSVLSIRGFDRYGVVNIPIWPDTSGLTACVRRSDRL